MESVLRFCSAEHEPEVSNFRVARKPAHVTRKTTKVDHSCTNNEENPKTPCGICRNLITGATPPKRLCSARPLDPHLHCQIHLLDGLVATDQRGRATLRAQASLQGGLCLEPAIQRKESETAWWFQNISQLKHQSVGAIIPSNVGK